MPKGKKGQKGYQKVEFVGSNVPNFLRPHAHLLSRRSLRDGGTEARAEAEAKAKAQVREVKERQKQEEEEEEEDTRREQELEEKDLPVDIQAQLLKHRANQAFSSGNYRQAIELFTSCIALDPHEAVYFSNRSAAYAKVKQFELALSDGRKASRLREDWPKAHSRIGLALFGLEDFEEALKSFEKVLELDPNDKLARESITKCTKCIERQRQDAAAGKHSFRKRKTSSGRDGGGDASGGNQSRTGDLRVKKRMLSFEEEDE